jgi:hypothetical protein
MLIISRCWFFIILGIVLLREGMAGVGIYDLSTLWQLGFGQVNANAIVGSAPSGLIAKVLFANLPQGILSFLYLTYNGLYSCMLGAHEWSLFATRRRTVRVTAPVGKQRSTYYLQLPYWYAIVSSTFRPSDLWYSLVIALAHPFRSSPLAHVPVSVPSSRGYH